MFSFAGNLIYPPLRLNYLGSDIAYYVFSLITSTHNYSKKGVSHEILLMNAASKFGIIILHFIIQSIDTGVKYLVIEDGGEI